MANDLPVVLSSLTFNGTDLQREDLTLHLDVASGLNDGIDVRGEDTIIPSAAGRTARNRKRDVRHLLLSGFLQGDGATEADRLASWQALRDEVEALFDPADDPGTLTGVALDGSTRTITARALNIIWIGDDSLLGVNNLAIALDSADPDWVVS